MLQSAEISSLPPFCPPAESQWRFSVSTTFFQAEKTSKTAKWRRDFKLRIWWFWWRFEAILERTTLRDNSSKSGASRWRQFCQLQPTNPPGRASQKWSKLEAKVSDILRLKATRVLNIANRIFCRCWLLPRSTTASTDRRHPEFSTSTSIANVKAG